jgi:hypothetical protein
MNDDLMLLKQLEDYKDQHRILDQEIDELTKAPWQDELVMARLRKQKLRLRDLICQLECEIYPDVPA